MQSKVISARNKAPLRLNPLIPHQLPPFLPLSWPHERPAVSASFSSATVTAANIFVQWDSSFSRPFKARYIQSLHYIHTLMAVTNTKVL